MKNLYLSIIIPVYNMEAYLPQCLASLKRQNFGSEVEILLLDDGSTDASPQLCDEASEESTIIRVFHQKNRGVAATRNRGLRESHGTYIAWVDPDDYITDDWWKVLKPMLANAPQMVYFDMKRLENGKITESHYDKESRIIPRKEWIQELANGNRIMSHLWSKIILRTLFDHSMTFNESLGYCEDYEAMHRITFPVREVVYLHDCLYVYRRVNTSLVHDETKLLDNLWLGVELAKKRRNFYQKRGINVSNFGVLHCQLVFCMACAESPKILAAQIQVRYKKSLKDLWASRQVLLQGTLRKGERIRLFLLHYHIYFLMKVAPIVKMLAVKVKHLNV